MSKRRAVAAAILAVWVLVLGWHVRREYFRPEASRLAAAARRLPPGTAYYALYQGDRRAGWAQREVDTLPLASGFHLRDLLVIELPDLGPAGMTEARTDAWLGPTLALRRFAVQASSPADTTRVQGRVEGDTAIVLAVARGSAWDSVRRRVRGPVDLEGTWPPRLAATARSEPGERYEVRLLDPLSLESRPEVIEVLERGMRTFPDSADSDTASGVWYAAREDTVAALRVERGAGASTLEAWVDVDGRIVSGDLKAGLRMVRTAFELAFFDRRPGGPTTRREPRP
ncbi:MAG: hypothetical protein ACE5HF_08300 [Gemmatimonadota bacterium]